MAAKKLQKRNSALNSSYLLGNKEFYDLASLHGNTAYSGVSDVFIAALATARDDEWRSSDEMEKLRNHLAALDPSAIEDLAYDIAYGTDNSGGGAVGLIFQPQALLLEALENNPELQDLARDSFAQGSIQQAQDRAQIADITGSILDKLTNGEPLDSDEKWIIVQIGAGTIVGIKTLKGSPALARVAAKLGKPIKDFAQDQSGGKKPSFGKAGHAASVEAQIAHNKTPSRNTGGRGSSGISGGHNMADFEAFAKANDVKYTKTAVPGQPGVYQIEYQMPKLDSKTNLPTGEHKAVNKTPKTVYDPSVLSDQKIAEMSQKAAQQAKFGTTKLPNGSVEPDKATTVTIDGYNFRVTRNDPDKSNGEITNVFISE